jgi:hypothetical protein
VGSVITEAAEGGNRLEAVPSANAKGESLGGKFDPQKLENALNSFATEGWVLCAAATADITASFAKDRQEMVMILERDAQ